MKKQKRALTNKEKQAVNKIMKKAEKKGLKGKKKRTFRDDVIGFIIDFGILFTLGMLGLPSFGTNEDTDMEDDRAKMKNLREKFGAARARANYQRQTGQSIDQRHAQLKKAADKATARRKAADKDVDDFAKERKAKLRAMGIKDDVNEVLDRPGALDSYKKKAKMRSDKARNSATAKVVRGNQDISKEKEIIRKRERGQDMADRVGNKHFRKSIGRGYATQKEDVQLDEISRGVKALKKNFGPAVDPKAYNVYKKFVKKHKIDEPTVRMCVDNPNDAECKRMMKDKNIAQAVKLRKASLKEFHAPGMAPKPTRKKPQTSTQKSLADIRKKDEATIPQGKTAMTKRPDLTRNDADKLAKLKKMMDRERAARKNK